MSNTPNQPHPVSPASAANAGAHFEARVGAYYMLTMIAGGEPRGLPGATITTVAFQQRMADHPLDDVVIHATSSDGTDAILEIQAKRSLTFTASDNEFSDVVTQIWTASQKPEFASSRYELAVAISRTTTRVEHAVKEVLHWARTQGDATTFHANIQRKGFSSDGMRNFVEVFRENLRKCGAPEDDVTVWSLLRRFQILVFDFEAVGSEFEHYARERCRFALATDQGGRAGDLWAGLVNDAETTGRAAGTRSRQQVVEKFAVEGGYRFAVELAHGPSFARLAEEARFALLDVEDHIGGARLSRTALVEEGNAQLVSAPLLNIKGAPGSGKSMVLKRLVEQSAEQGRVIVLRGGRIVGGGWLHLAHSLGTMSSPERFFTDLAAAGGATLFVDNIDQIDDVRERATMSDLLNVAANYSGWRVVVTTTEDSDEWTKILPASLRDGIAVLAVPEISDDEAAVLSEQNNAIADLLRPDHPAKRIARNLFYLSRLVSAGSADARTISTETDLARLWWGYGGGRDRDSGRFGRLKAMRRMGTEFLAHPGRPATKVDDLESPVVAELLRLNAAREEVLGAEVAFRHDVYRDWTVGLMIADDPEILKQLPKEEPVSAAVVRGLELAARFVLDADPTGRRWHRLLEYATGPNSHGSWRRPILLALPRAERALEHFVALKSVLLADDGALLAELVRLLVVVDSQPIADVLRQVKPDLKIPAEVADFVYPKGPSWWPTIAWLTGHARELPPPVIPDVAKAFMSWLMLTSGFGRNIPLNTEIVAVLFEWLELLGEELRPRSFARGEALPTPLNIPHHKLAYELVRMAAFSFALVNVDAARGYMANLNHSDVRNQEFEAIIKGRGELAKAAPAEFADFFMAGIVDPEEDGSYSSYRDHGPFGYHEHVFLTAGPNQGPMLEMLKHSPAEGLALVRRIVEHATDWQRKRYRRSNTPFPGFTVPLVWGKQCFEGDTQVYRFARTSVPSSITTSALMALELWAHQRIEADENPEAVLRDVLGPEGSSCAFVAVGLDIILSHWPKLAELAWPFAATPEVLKLDEERHVRDLTGVDNFGLFTASETDEALMQDQLKNRSSRKTRLMNTFPYYVLNRKVDIGPQLKTALEKASNDIPPPQPGEDADMLSGLYAVARRAARMADRSNWKPVKGAQQDGTEVDLIQYAPDEAEQKLIDAKTSEVDASTHRANMLAMVHLAFSDTARATPQVVADAVAWARAEPPPPTTSADGDDFEVKQSKRAVLMAAVLAVRHMAGDDRSDTIEWATSAFRTAMSEPEEESYGAPHVEYNAKAIAAAGLMTLYDQASDQTLRADLLELATSQHAAVANALAGGFARLREGDQPFLRSILRVFLLTANYVHHQYDGGEEKRLADRAAVVKSAIAAELTWLKYNNSEPAWPQIAPWQVRPRRRLRIPGPGVEEETSRKPHRAQDLCADESRLGLISSHLVSLAVCDRPTWLIELTKHLANWAIEANGPDEEGRDGDRRPFTFNANFFDYLGILVAALPHDEAITYFVEPILEFPDEACVDTLATLLRGFDRAVNSTDAKKPLDPYALRRVLARRLQQSRSYNRLTRDKSFTCEMYLGGALCAMFYQAPRMMQLGPPLPPCPPGDFVRALPTLTALVVGAPTSGYIAVLFLDLVELSAKPPLLPFVLEAVMVWCKAYDADTSFWGNNDIGARTCVWFTKALGGSLTAQQRSDLRGVLDVLVRAGVTSARVLEDIIDAI